MLDFPSLLYKGLRILLMFQLSGVYCKSVTIPEDPETLLASDITD